MTLPEQVDNPFVLVQNGLWTCLESDSGFCELVKEGNRIKFDKANALKQQISSADTPEVVIANSTQAVNLNATSNGTEILRRYDIMLNTGDFRLNPVFNQVEWAVVVGLLEWKRVLGALQWKGNSFVKRTAVIDVRSGVSDKEANRGLQGWSSVWGCEVLMYFKTLDINPNAFA